MAACTVHNAGECYATEYMDEADNVPDRIPGAAHGVSCDAGGAGATRHLCLRRHRREQPLLVVSRPNQLQNDPYLETLLDLDAKTGAFIPRLAEKWEASPI